MNKKYKANYRSGEHRSPENKHGITLIALIITVIILLILAGTAISIAINGGDIFDKTSQARELWNDAVAKEENSINNLLYFLDQIPSSENSLDIKYQVMSDRILIFPQPQWEREYYNSLTQLFLSAQSYWAAYDGVIEEGSSFSDFNDYINCLYNEGNISSNNYNTLQEYYYAEVYGFEDCLDFVLSLSIDYMWCAEFNHNPDDPDCWEGYDEFYNEKKEELYDKFRATLPEEYYITVTCGEFTEVIDLVEFEYVEFEIKEGFSLQVTAHDEQTSQYASISIKVPKVLVIFGKYNDLYINFELGMTWRQFVNSEYGTDFDIVNLGDYYGTFLVRKDQTGINLITTYSGEPVNFDSLINPNGAYDITNILGQMGDLCDFTSLGISGEYRHIWNNSALDELKSILNLVITDDNNHYLEGNLGGYKVEIRSGYNRVDYYDNCSNDHYFYLGPRQY